MTIYEKKKDNSQIPRDSQTHFDRTELYVQRGLKYRIAEEVHPGGSLDQLFHEFLGIFFSEVCQRIPPGNSVPRKIFKFYLRFSSAHSLPIFFRNSHKFIGKFLGNFNRRFSAN